MRPWNGRRVRMSKEMESDDGEMETNKKTYIARDLASDARPPPRIEPRNPLVFHQTLRGME